MSSPLVIALRFAGLLCLGIAQGAAAEAELREGAERALQQSPLSVTHKNVVSPSGDPRDYVSTAPYFWPDPNQPDGLPYIRRDGEVYPGSRTDESDFVRSRTLSRTVDSLVRAYRKTGEETYAAHAALLLRTWFIESATAMNPHLDFAQGIPGVNTGRRFGIIEGTSLVSALENAGRLVGSPAWTDTDHAALLRWADAFLDWYLTSQFGLEEADMHNNHGTHYDVQVMRLGRMLGREDLVWAIAELAKTRRIATQIEPDGRQPHELSRTRALSYSAMNLRGMMTIARMGAKAGSNLWHFETADGRSIRRALDFLVPYVADPNQPWPYAQITPFDPADFAPLLREAAVVYDDDSYAVLADRFVSPPPES